MGEVNSRLGERLAFAEGETVTQNCTERAILWALVSFSNADWVCWPSVRSVAEDSRAHEGTVRRVLATWEGAGLISREKRFTPAGGCMSSIITVHPERWSPASAAREARVGSDEARVRARVAPASERASEPSIEPSNEPRAVTTDSEGFRHAPGSGRLGTLTGECETCGGTRWVEREDKTMVPCPDHGMK